MRKLKFGSLLVDKGLSNYEPFLLKVLSGMVLFPDGDNLLNKYINMRDKINSISATGIYIRVVDKLPAEPIKNIIYLIDENKEENSFPEAVLIKIVEKLPDVIEEDIVYLIDDSCLTEDGTAGGASANIDINVSLSHSHDNLQVLNTYDMEQDELLEAVKAQAVAAAVAEATELVDDLQVQVTDIKEIVGEGFEPIPNETIDALDD